MVAGPRYAYSAWDEIRSRPREPKLRGFCESYGAEILHLVDGAPFDAAVLPDSFTVRLRISGKGLKDFVLNYPYIFEVVEPEDIALPQLPGGAPAAAPSGCGAYRRLTLTHRLYVSSTAAFRKLKFSLHPAIDQASSHCFLPGKNANDVGDFVQPGGHGTRVGGAVLYGEAIPKGGTPKLPFWIQNARVLDEHNSHAGGDIPSGSAARCC